MNQKGISPILIILIIVGVLVIGGLFWYYQKTLQIISEPAPQVTPADKTADFTPSEVEGWQTYRNEEYGFEVKYPIDFVIQEEVPISKYRKYAYPSYPRKWIITIDSPDLEFISEAKETNRAPKYEIIELQTNGASIGLSSSQLTYENLNDKWISEVTDYTPTTVNNVLVMASSSEGWIDTIPPMPEGENSEEISPYSEKVLFYNNKTGEIICWSLETINKSKSIYKPVFDQILSTFKFIE